MQVVLVERPRCPAIPGVCRARTSASIRRLSAQGVTPTRTNGLRTADGTCQEIRIWVFGSAPKARWRPNGVTAEPGTRLVAGFGVAPAARVPLPPPGPAQPASSPPPANALADTSARRRVSFVRRYSYCSAMLMLSTSSRGMPTSGTGSPGGVTLEEAVMSGKFPACANGRRTYG